MFRAKICESLQHLLFSSSKPESKMLGVVTIKKFRSDSPFVINGVCQSIRQDDWYVGKIFVS